jgi:hypothetical protein
MDQSRVSKGAARAVPTSNHNDLDGGHGAKSALVHFTGSDRHPDGGNYFSTLYVPTLYASTWAFSRSNDAVGAARSTVY